MPALTSPSAMRFLDAPAAVPIDILSRAAARVESCSRWSVLSAAGAECCPRYPAMPLSVTLLMSLAGGVTAWADELVTWDSWELVTVRGMLRAEPGPRASDCCDCFGDAEARGDSSTTSVWDDEDAASPDMEEAAMGDWRPSGERESAPPMVGGMSRGCAERARQTHGVRCVTSERGVWSGPSDRRQRQKGASARLDAGEGCDKPRRAARVQEAVSKSSG